MGSCAVPKNGYSHLSSTIAPLILIRNICFGVNSKYSIAVVVIIDIRIIPTRENGVALVIAIFSSPVASTTRFLGWEHISVIIKGWLEVCYLANLRKIITNCKVSDVTKIKHLRRFLNVLWELLSIHSTSSSCVCQWGREKTAYLSVCWMTPINCVADYIGSVFILHHLDEHWPQFFDQIAARRIYIWWKERTKFIEDVYYWNWMNLNYLGY